MNLRKVDTVLQKIPPSEHQRVLAFLFSRYGKKNKRLQLFARVYMQSLARYGDAPDFAEQIYQKVYPKKPFRATRFNNLSSDFYHELLAYRAQQLWLESPLGEQEYRIRWLRQNDLLQFAQQETKRGQKTITANDQQSVEDYFHRMQLLQHQDQIAISTTRKASAETLQAVSDQLDLYYLAQKLRLACDMHSRAQVVNQQFISGNIDALIQDLENRQLDLKPHPMIRLYLKTWLMLQEGRDADVHFHELVPMLRLESRAVVKRDAITLYQYAINHAVRRSNTGDPTFYQATFDLYQDLLQQGLLLQGGYLSQWAYINILTAALRLRQFDWAENFLQTYQQELRPKIAKHVFSYGMANLYYERGDLGEALHQLHSVEFTDAFYQLATKLIQLKCYYDLEETEAFLSLVTASRSFLRRNRQLSTYQKRANANFLSLVERLYLLRNRASTLKKEAFKTALEKVVSKLAKTDPLSNRGWLEERMDKL